MPVMEHGEVRIAYEESGAGFPVLTLAPGGMNSTAAAWSRAPWDPVAALAPDHRVITMDQRNAGGSWAPVRAEDGWGSYAGDQLALLDHLGIERCHLFGMCIGGAFIAALLARAPERFAAAVALQPIGLEGNRGLFHQLFDAFAADRAPAHPEAADADWAGMRARLYDADHTLFSVPDATLPTLVTPLLVLVGGDEHHPESASRTLADLAPNATLLERWKAPEHVDAAQDAAAGFLARHTPA